MSDAENSIRQAYINERRKYARAVIASGMIYSGWERDFEGVKQPAIPDGAETVSETTFFRGFSCAFRLRLFNGHFELVLVTRVTDDAVYVRFKLPATESFDTAEEVLNPYLILSFALKNEKQ